MLNVPPRFPSLHDIAPVGTIGRFDVSVSVAVNCTWDPGVIGIIFGTMVVVTVCSTLAVKVDVEELPECVPSPP